MLFFELLKAIFLGMVEGITEWLPVSSTGHLILVQEFISLNQSKAFFGYVQYCYPIRSNLGCYRNLL